MHELSKGQESFWYPYLQITEKPDLLIMWSDEQLDELQDPVLKQNVIEEREIAMKDFLMIKDFAGQ